MAEKAAARIGILTVSDRASRGEYEDRSGPAVEDYLANVLSGPWEARSRIVPDEAEQIAAALETLCDDEGCCLVITTGGTGPSPRDVTPDATEAVCDRMMPGFGETMRAVSVPTVPTAILSRQVAGLRGNSLIINLPGSPRAITQCLKAVFPAVPHCVELIGGPLLQADMERVPEIEHER